jgi:hypothetical protein
VTTTNPSDRLWVDPSKVWVRSATYDSAVETLSGSRPQVLIGAGVNWDQPALQTELSLLDTGLSNGSASDRGRQIFRIESLRYTRSASQHQPLTMIAGVAQYLGGMTPIPGYAPLTGLPDEAWDPSLFTPAGALGLTKLATSQLKHSSSIMNGATAPLMKAE